jgi:hypothetical protein
MPTSKKGEWLFDYEKQMDTLLIRYIKELLLRQIEVKKNKSICDKTRYNRFTEINTQLSALRKQAVFYAEYSALDNIDILGEEFIKDQKRNLPPIMFQTSILGMRIRKIQGGFYAALNEDLHYYEASTEHLHNQLVLDFNKLANNCLSDSDLDESRPLVITFDYNANINWCVVCQHDERKHWTRKSFFTKYNRKLRELCRDFCDYYDPRFNRDVVYYYDSTAIKNSYADENAEAFCDIVINELTRRGYNVNPIYIGQQMRHDLKHQQLDDAFKGQKGLFPLINKYNNEELTLGMETTGIKIGRNGFEKDKSGEKLVETADNPLESRTDGTDAWDTNWIGCNSFPATFAVISPPSWG